MFPLIEQHFFHGMTVGQVASAVRNFLHAHHYHIEDMHTDAHAVTLEAKAHRRRVFSRPHIRISVTGTVEGTSVSVHSCEKTKVARTALATILTHGLALPIIAARAAHKRHHEKRSEMHELWAAVEANRHMMPVHTYQPAAYVPPPQAM